MPARICVHESEIPPEHHPDRWSKDLIGGADVPLEAAERLIALAKEKNPKLIL